MMGPWGYWIPSSVIGASMCQGHHGGVNLKYGFVIMGLCGLMVLMDEQYYATRLICKVTDEVRTLALRSHIVSNSKR